MGGRVGISIPGRLVRVMVVCVIAAGLAAACATSNSASGPRTSASPNVTWTTNVNDCLVGGAFFNMATGDTLDFLEPMLEQAIPAVFGSFSYKARDAKSRSEWQVENIDELVRAGVKVLIIWPSYDGADLPAVQRAVEAGIAVIVIGQPIAAKSLYIGFDQVEAGRQEAKALLAVKPKGRYVIVGGSDVALDSDPIAAGIREVLRPAVDRGDVTIAATVVWDGAAMPAENLSTMLSQSGGHVDAVVAESDGVAYELQSALAEAGLADKVAIAGVNDYGGSHDGLFGIARGTQAVDVWENDELVARATVRAAIALCHDQDIARVDGSASVTWFGHDPMTAILLEPVAITKDNLSIVITTDMYWRQLVCGDGRYTGDLPPACQLGPVPDASASASSQP